MTAFLKLHGLGNDFVAFDARDTAFALTPVQARKVADRHFGIGCDTVVAIRPGGAEADASLLFYNADGSESESCFNASRCVARLLMDERGLARVKLLTKGGLLVASDAGKGLVTVDMGAPHLQWQQVPLAQARDTTSFTLEVGETSGSVHFCIPYSTLEPIRDVLYSTIQGDSVEPDRRWVNLLKAQIQSAEVDLVAELGTAPATVEQLLSLKPGDFVELHLDPMIQAKVDGVPVFDCHYGTSAGKYAIKIDRLLTSSNLSWLGEGNGS